MKRWGHAYIERLDRVMRVGHPHDARQALDMLTAALPSAGRYFVRGALADLTDEDIDVCILMFADALQWVRSVQQNTEVTQ